MRRCDKSVRCSSIGYGVRKRHRVTKRSVAATANDITENTAVDLEELEVKANTVVMDGKRTTLIPTPCDKKFASDGIGFPPDIPHPAFTILPYLTRGILPTTT